MKLTGLFLLLGACVSNASAFERDLSQYLASPAILGLDIYQHYLSPAKGTSCPMEPSDSAYARQAVNRYGLFQGVLMSADRLHRCGHDVGHYPIVHTSRGLKFADPVEPPDASSIQ